MTAFSPAGTATLAVTSSSGNVALAKAGMKVLQIRNVGSKVAFWKLGSNSGATAAVTDTPIGAGEIAVVDPGAATYMAAICGGSDTTTLYFTSGAGGVPS